jgi:transcriptional regulator with XRE-family HTH domain
MRCSPIALQNEAHELLRDSALASEPGGGSPLLIHDSLKVGGSVSTAHTVENTTTTVRVKYPAAMEMPTFSTWFRKQLARREWNMSDFARKANIPPQTVQTWVSGRSIPEPYSCDLIADVLGISYQEVMQVAGHLPPDRPTSEDDPRIILHALVDRIDWTRDNRLRTVEGILRMFVEDDRKIEGAEDHAGSGGQDHEQYILPMAPDRYR